MRIELEERNDIDAFPVEVRKKIYQLFMKHCYKKIVEHVKSSIESGITSIFPIRVQNEEYGEYGPDEELHIRYGMHPAKEMYLLSNDRMGGFDSRFTMELSEQLINLQVIQEIEVGEAKAFLLKRIDESKPGFAFLVSRSVIDGNLTVTINVIECK